MAGSKNARKKNTSTSGAGGDPKNSTEACGKCKQVVNEKSESSVECEVCHCWFHVSCVGVPEGVLEFMNTSGLHWFCTECDQPTSRLERIETKVDKIQELVNNSIETKIVGLQKTYAEAVSRLESNSTVIANAAKTSLKRDETESKQNRDRNVVIFGITESNIEGTIESVKSILDECHINTTLDKGTMFRLGRYDENKTDTDSKPRPVKLCTETKHKKWDILKAVNELNKPGVFARLDLSKAEQEEDFRLRKKLKELRANQPSKKFKIKNKAIIELTN